MGEPSTLFSLTPGAIHEGGKYTYILFSTFLHWKTLPYVTTGLSFTRSIWGSTLIEDEATYVWPWSAVQFLESLLLTHQVQFITGSSPSLSYHKYKTTTQGESPLEVWPMTVLVSRKWEWSEDIRSTSSMFTGRFGAGLKVWNFVYGTYCGIAELYRVSEGIVTDKTDCARSDLSISLHAMWGYNFIAAYFPLGDMSIPSRRMSG